MEGIRLFSTQRKKHVVSCRMITSSKKVDDARKTYDSRKGRFLKAFQKMVLALDEFDWFSMDEMLKLCKRDPSKMIIIIPKIGKKLDKAREKIVAALEEFRNLFSKLNEFHTLSMEEKKELCLHDHSKMMILAKAKKKLFGYLIKLHKEDHSDMLRLAQDFAMVRGSAAFGYALFTSLFEPWFRTLRGPHVIGKYVSKWHSHPLFNYSAARAARKEKEANTRRSTLNQIEFDKAIRKLLKKHHSIHNEANKLLSTPVLTEICEAILKILLENNTLLVNTVQQLIWSAYPPATRKEANTQRSTLQQVEFDKAIRKLLKKCHAIHKEGNKLLSIPQQIEFEKAVCKLLKIGHAIHKEANKPLSTPLGNTVQQMYKALAGRSYPPSPGLPMALPSNDPASVGASIDDDPNHIENPGHEPSSSMEGSPSHAPDIISSSNGACDDGNRNRAPPSKQMAMALPSNDPASVGASIDYDPNHIENPGDEPSSSMEASLARATDITSSNGACDAGNHSPPSTQMPMALPSNDPASVAGSSDDDPIDIENPRDASSSSMEASPAHPLDMTLSSNGASLPVRDDGSERREPPVPNGNRDLEAMHNRAIPKEVLLMFALQVIQILFTVKSGDISLLSREAKILQYCAEAITGIGFFCGLGVILLRNRRNLRAATEIMSAIGFFSTALGFITTMCVPLPNESMFWILGCIGFPFSAVFAYLLWKGWIV